MASASTLTTIAYTLKTVYKDGVPENLATRERVFLSRVRKRGGFTGKNLVVPVRYGNPQGVSSSFSKAKTNAGSSSGDAFTVTRAKKYGFATIDAETIAATEDNKGAFVEAITGEVDSTIDEVGERASQDLYGDGSGAIGRIKSVNGNTATLYNSDDVKNFAKGKVCDFNPTKTGAAGSLRGTAKVTAVDEDNGKVTFDTLTGLADDYIYGDGDYDAALKGLEAWIPVDTSGLGTAFFGVQRDTDVARLAGSRITDTTLPPEEAIKKLAILIQKRGGRPTDGYINPVQWDIVQKRLEAAVQREQGGDGVTGFEFIYVQTPKGRVRLYADPACPIDRCWLLDPRSWVLRHLRAFPHVVMDDGLRSLRQTDDDGVEVRIRYWAQLICDAPGWNGVAKLVVPI